MFVNFTEKNEILFKYNVEIALQRWISVMTKVKGLTTRMMPIHFVMLYYLVGCPRSKWRVCKLVSLSLSLITVFKKRKQMVTSTNLTFFHFKNEMEIF